jgi:hypothetical protein
MKPPEMSFPMPIPYEVTWLNVDGALVHLPAMSLQPRSVGTQMMFSAAGKSIRMNSEKALKI